MLGFITSGLKAVGSVLAKAGVIRGTLGKILGGGVPTMGAQPSLPQMGAIGTSLTKFVPGVGLVAAAGTAVATGAVGGVVKRYGKKILAGIAAGVLFESGGRIWNRLTGEEVKTTRRMNYSNPKALKRGIRRVEGASKQYAKLLRATTGGIKKCGYTVTPRKKRRGCA